MIEFKKRATWKYLICLSFPVLLGSVVLPLDNNAFAGGANFKIFPVDSEPYNMTYSEWAGKWWQWGLEIPQSESPFFDQNGEHCALSQSGPVWFLAGNAGGFAERECTIPNNTAIMVSPLNAECSKSEYPAMSLSELQHCSGTFFDNFHTYSVFVDDEEVETQDIHRVKSGPFEITFPENNIYGVEPGPTQAVADGYYIILMPLSPGEHVIRASGSSLDPSVVSPETFDTETITRIIVSPTQR